MVIGALDHRIWPVFTNVWSRQSHDNLDKENEQSRVHQVINNKIMTVGEISPRKTRNDGVDGNGRMAAGAERVEEVDGATN